MSEPPLPSGAASATWTRQLSMAAGAMNAAPTPTPWQMNIKLIAAALFALFILPKFIPFPFFLPLWVFMMAICVRLAEKGAERHVVLTLIALQFAPYFLAAEKDLNDVESWGNLGPNLAPFKGVYLFDGLPAATMDWSHCLWNDGSKVAYCHLPRVHSVWPSGLDMAQAGFEPTADPSAEALTMPWWLFTLFYHVTIRNRLDFHFNNALTEAMVYENICFAATASPSPLAMLFPYGLCTPASVYSYSRTFTMVSDGANPPTWYRNTYAQTSLLPFRVYERVLVNEQRRRAGGTAYPAKMQFGDGYKLLPLLTPNRDGSQRLHKRNLARAMKLSSKVIMRDL